MKQNMLASRLPRTMSSSVSTTARYTLFTVSAVCCILATRAQTAASEDPAYTRTISQRAEKIVATLGLPDTAGFHRVQGIIMDQYRGLNNIYNERDAQIKIAKADTAAGKDAIAQKIKAATDAAAARTAALHTEYLSKLAAALSPEQIVKVKDGMTYSVLPITYKAYLEMLPDLTEAQKAQLLAWLTEAREYAMDAESSEKKHAWFGKYKGRINNYLSAAGIDMKKAGEDWEKRRKAANGG